VDPVSGDTICIIDSWIGSPIRRNYTTHHNNTAWKIEDRRHQTYHGQRAAPPEDDLLELHEYQHGDYRDERCYTPQPLLHVRWKNGVLRYEVERTE